MCHVNYALIIRGAIPQVMSRGDRPEETYHDDVDRQEFVKTVAGACQQADWQVHTCCLRRNHFHLGVETPKGNLAQGMHWLLIEQLQEEGGGGATPAVPWESAEAKADRMMAEELDRMGWGAGVLEARRKSGPGKVRLAARLRKETVLSAKRIAARVQLGGCDTGNAHLCAWMKQEKKTTK